MSNDFKFYFDELKGHECQCGWNKKPGRSFCYTCFKSLPADMKRALYQPIGRGYEEAYDEAVKYLND